MAIFESVQFLNDTNIPIPVNEAYLKKDKLPESFKQKAIEVAKLVEKESIAPTVGSGSKLVDYFSTKDNLSTRFEEQHVKNPYQILVFKFDLHILNFTVSKKAKEFCDIIFTKCGFKKGKKVLGGVISSNMYYIEDGEFLYTAQMTSYNTGIYSMYNILIGCFENNEKNRKGVVED